MRLGHFLGMIFHQIYNYEKIFVSSACSCTCGCYYAGIWGNQSPRWTLPACGSLCKGIWMLVLLFWGGDTHHAWQIFSHEMYNMSRGLGSSNIAMRLLGICGHSDLKITCQTTMCRKIIPRPMQFRSIPGASYRHGLQCVRRKSTWCDAWILTWCIRSLLPPRIV